MWRWRILAAILILGGCTEHVDDLTFVSIEALHDDNVVENLRLRFRSNANLWNAAEGTMPYAKISLCPFHESPWISLARIQYNGVDVTGFEVTPQARAEKGPFVYDVRFVYNGQQIEDYRGEYGELAARRIAIADGPQDLCVKVRGGRMLGGGIVSNEFRIPADALAGAVATATMPPQYRP